MPVGRPLVAICPKCSRLTLASTFGLALVLSAAIASAAPPKHVNYSRDIRPILSNTCYKCHGPDEKQRKAGLRLDTKDGAYAKLESGEVAVVPGASTKSAIIQRLTAHDPDVRMPPADSGKTVTPEQIDLIKRWIDQGGEFHGHWAFLQPQHSPAPPVQHPELARNPIDRFILARLDEEGLAPSPPADKPALIRRVSLDLTGLPPTLAEVDRFVADNSPDAYDKLVNRLLDSPQYGEQMTRYWLDAARYGDSHGMHLDNERSIWPYRDWLIRAFNSNKPFDRFAVEQLAGDLLPDATIDQRVATGFSRCNVTTGEGGAIDEEFYCRYAIDRVATTGTVFLGLTLGCCVCHDHKFDPITQREFYQLFGYFGSLTERAMDGNALLPPPALESRPAQRRKEGRAAQGGNRRAGNQRQAKVRDLRRSGDPRVPASAAARLGASRRQRGAWPSQGCAPLAGRCAGQADGPAEAALREYYIRYIFSSSRSLFDPLNEKLAAERKELIAAEATAPSTLVMQDMPKPRDIYVLIRGAYDHKGDKVVPGVPAAIGPRLPKDAPPNRLSLAHWIVDPRNPLTARVTVNRFWQQYFGTGLVKTAEDFGAQGEWPTHPELLDWLATEFVQSGWNVKHIQRLIVTSATYRQSSHVTRRTRSARSRESPAGARPAIPPRRRGGSRHGPGRQRPVGRHDRRQERQAVSAARLVGGDRLQRAATRSTSCRTMATPFIAADCTRFGSGRRPRPR